MKKTLAPILAAILSTYGMAAFAATIVGSSDCTDWTRKPAESKRQWLLGYLSGLNVMHDFNDGTPNDPLSTLSSPNQAYQWIDSYCQKNPSGRIDAAASELFVDLMKQRQR